MTKTEKKIEAFCNRNGIAFEWQNMKYDVRRAIVKTGAYDFYWRDLLMKKARRLVNVRVKLPSYDIPGDPLDFYMQDEEAAAAADVRAAREWEHAEKWAMARHSAWLAGMEWEKTAAYAESLYPTPAAF